MTCFRACFGREGENIGEDEGKGVGGLGNAAAVAAAGWPARSKIIH